MVETVAARLIQAVDDAAGRWQGLGETAASTKPAPEKWSPKEILGHLIDSAANNHQRFVRAQLAEAYEGPGYEQDAWVRVEAHNRRPWADLVTLWRAYNHHLAHVIRQIPEERLQTLCRIGANEPVTLGYVVEDYLAHLEHHVRQIDHLAANPAAA